MPFVKSTNNSDKFNDYIISLYTPGINPKTPNFLILQKLWDIFFNFNLKIKNLLECFKHIQTYVYFDCFTEIFRINEFNKALDETLLAFEKEKLQIVSIPHINMLTTEQTTYYKEVTNKQEIILNMFTEFNNNLKCTGKCDGTCEKLLNDMYIKFNTIMEIQ